MDEVAELVAINPERVPAFKPEEILEDPMDALKICSSLVTTATVDEPNFAERSRSDYMDCYCLGTLLC